MRRREFLRALGACAVCAAPGAAWAIGPEEARVARPAPPIPGQGARPNVILVLCDDLGWGDLGAFWQNARASAGNVHIDTPNLDAAMRRGVMLTQAYTTAPVCAPARASMVTGKHQGHCNLRDNMFDRPVDAHMTLGTVMKAAGYATWHIGKWGIGGGYESGGQPRRAMACDAGFDYSYGYPAHGHGHSFYHWQGAEGDWRNRNVGSPLVENLSAQAKDDPFYAALSAGATDWERDADGAYWRRLVADAEGRHCYDTDLFTAKIKQLILAHQEAGREAPFFCYACYTTSHGSGASHGDPEMASTDPFHVPGNAYPAEDPADVRWGGGVRWEKDARGFLPFKALDAQGTNTSNTWIHPDYQAYATVSQRRYATNVRRLDDALGDLLRFLRLRGLERDTLFVFTSDNGPAGEYLTPAGIDWVEGAFDSNGPWRGMKRWSYEGGLREPTFALWPGTIPASGAETPRQSAFPFQFPAWMATLADVAGLPQPAHCDGVSLLPTLTGQGRQLPMRLYAEYNDGGSGQGFGFEQWVRDGDYVLIRNNGINGTRELYDLAADPGQTRDLLADPAHAERVRWMTDLLVACRVPVAKVPDACGALGAYANSHPGIEAAPMPATPRVGPPPPLEVRLHRAGAEAWPWVPNFRTLAPDGGFLAKDFADLLARLPPTGAYGVEVRGWFEAPAEGDRAFAAKGPGGCQLWLHEAHILEYEAGDCVEGRAITLRLAQGFHPWRLFLTTADGPSGLCALTGLA